MIEDAWIYATLGRSRRPFFLLYWRDVKMVMDVLWEDGWTA